MFSSIRGRNGLPRKSRETRNPGFGGLPPATDTPDAKTLFHAWTGKMATSRAFSLAVNVFAGSVEFVPVERPGPDRRKFPYASIRSCVYRPDFMEKMLRRS